MTEAIDLLRQRVAICSASADNENYAIRALTIKEANLIIEELEKNRWIPVEEKLPEHPKMQSEYVHVTDGKRVGEAYYYDYTSRETNPGHATGKGWYKHGMGRITHWKPELLPVKA